MRFVFLKLGGLCLLLFLISGFLLTNPLNLIQTVLDSSSDSDFVLIDAQKQSEHFKNSVDSFKGTNIENETDGSISNIPNLICDLGLPSGSSLGKASTILGDTLYVAGGGSPATNIVYRYHIPLGQWSAGRNMPFVKTGGDLVKCGNAIYYIGGGVSLTSGNFVTMRYRPEFGWDTVARIPRSITGNTAMSWGDSVIYSVAGGWDQFYEVVQVYRPAANTWTIIADSLPTGRGRRSHASGLTGNQIFVAAGFSAGTFRNDLMIGTIGPTANDITWEVGPNINCRGGMSRPGGTAIDGHFYVVGAETNPQPSEQDSIFIYELAGNRWLTSPLRGRGSGAGSNYWGLVSSKIINGNVNVFIPGGMLIGGGLAPFFVAKFRNCIDPIEPMLVLTGDTTIGSAVQRDGRRADRDTLFKSLIELASDYSIGYKDTSAGTIPPLLNMHKTLIIHELAADAVPVRYMSPAWRNAIKNWLASGSPGDKKTLIIIGGDIGYNYGRSNSPVYDSVLSKHFGNFVFKADNGNLAGENKVTWLNGNYIDSMTTSPPGLSSFWPDACSLFDLATGTALAIYTGRTAMDSLAVIGNAPVNENYVVVSIFQDPRYYAGAGGNDGDTVNSNRGFKRVLQLAMAWAKSHGSIITGFDDNSQNIVSGYELLQNFPNPFNPFTKINFSIPQSGKVILKIYDILGKHIATPVDNNLTPGSYSIDFNAAHLPSGMYFYELNAGSFRQVKKMVLVK